MRDVHTQLKRIFSTGRTQAVIFAGLAAITALLVTLYTPWEMWLRGGPKPAHAGPPKAVSPADIAIHAELSQTKLIQGQNGTVYVNLGIQTPRTSQRHAERGAVAPPSANRYGGGAGPQPLHAGGEQVALCESGGVSLAPKACSDRPHRPHRL